MAGKEETNYNFYCDVDGCNYGCDRKDHMKQHKANKHNIDAKEFKCPEVGCNYTAGQKGHLNVHLNDTHKKGKMLYCSYADCDYETPSNRAMTSHKKNSHKVGVKWYYCDFKNCKERRTTQQNIDRHKLTHTNERKFKCDVDGCNDTFNAAYDLKSHKNRAHDEKEKKIACDVADCVKGPFLTVADLKSHKRHFHRIDVKKMHKCNVGKCDKEFIKPATLKQHKADAHGIGVVLHYCSAEGCNKSFGQKSNCVRHMSSVHKINVKVFKCGVDGCDFEADQRWKMPRHKEEEHNMGKHKCDFCLQNRNSRNLHRDAQGKHFICDKCYKTATGKNSRKEDQMSQYLDKSVGTEYLLGSDKALKTMGGCQLYRPDKLYASDDMVIIVECDENQHKYSNGDYSCDEKRISDIYDEFAGKTMIVIRWNPDTYKPPEGKKLIMKDRLMALSKTFNDLRLKQHEDPVHIYYMYYDSDNPRIAENIPHTLMY